MTTQVQTVEIRMPQTTNVFLSIEKYPVCPSRLPNDFNTICIQAPNGDMYSWDGNGDASILSKDGTLRIYRRKPTVADAFNNISGYEGRYTRFYKDGSVEHRFNNYCYWWGPTYAAQPQPGVIIRSCQICNGRQCSRWHNLTLGSNIKEETGYDMSSKPYF
jgi:hypothetical protein